MKHALIALGITGALALGLDVLGDLTQTRPESSPPGSQTEVVLSVKARHSRPLAPLAAGLWGACQGTISSRLLEPGVAPVAGSEFRAVVEPALGKHARRRLTGCIEDATIDRMQGRVMSIRRVR